MNIIGIGIGIAIAIGYRFVEIPSSDTDSDSDVCWLGSSACESVKNLPFRERIGR